MEDDMKPNPDARRLKSCFCCNPSGREDVEAIFAYECEHQRKNHQQFDEFMATERGHMRYQIDDHFDLFGNFGYLKYNNFKEPKVEMEAVKNSIVKRLKNVDFLAEDMMHEENIDDIIADFAEEDEQRLADMDLIKQFYRNKKSIKLFHDGADCYLHLVCADTAGEACIISPIIIKKIVKRYEKMTVECFNLWYAQFSATWGFPYAGDLQFLFVVIHPDVWNYLNGCATASKLFILTPAAVIGFISPQSYNTVICNRETQQSLALKLQLNGVSKAIHGILEQINGLRKGIDNSYNNKSRRKELSLLLDQNLENLSTKRTVYEEKKEALKALHVSLAEEVVHPAMDETKEEVKIEFEVATNTAIATSAIENETVILDQPPISITSELMSDQIRKFPALTDRKIILDTIKLNADIARGEILKVYHMPYDLIKAGWKNPITNPFKCHEFYHGSMTLNVQTNIPKTNQFYSQIGVYSHWLQRDRRNEVVNVHTISQMPGGRINGHLAPSDRISVPFFSYVSDIPIRDNSQMLNMYHYSIFVVAMTPYDIATGGTTEAEMIIYAQFDDDLVFTGLRENNNILPTFTIPNEPVTPAMMALGASLLGGVKNTLIGTVSGVAQGLIGTANNVVRGSLKKASNKLNNKTEDLISQALAAIGSNEDKPTNFHNGALHQRAITNIASGNGLYDSDSLRLQECGTTPHPLFLIGKEKYSSISQIIETLGFINSIQIATTHVQGDLLGSFLIQPGVYNQTPFGALFPTGISNWTPLDHMAGWFMAYHGRIHYRFECVVDGFKTFRIRVAYVPNKLTLTYEESESCYFEVFDVGASLDAQTAFDFIVPYIHNQINYNHRGLDGVAHTAGSIHVFVEVKINMPEGLTPRADILVRKRACPGEFAFSIPRNNTSLLKVDNSEIPTLPDPEPPLPQWTTGVINLKVGQLGITDTVWVVDISASIGAGIPVSKFVGNLTGITNFIISGAAFWRSFSNSSISIEEPAIFLRLAANQPSQISISLQLDFALQGTDFLVLNREQISNNGTTIAINFQYRVGTPVIAQIPQIEITPAPPVEVVHPSGDMREAFTSAASITTSVTPVMESAHGENFMHLYENLRRFSEWHEVRLEAPATPHKVQILSLPLTLGGALLRGNLSNYQRSDKVTHIHDAFRFFRGSLRFIFSITTTANGIIRISHNPLVVKYPLTIEDQINQKQYTYSGFAETIISTQQNNVATVEVPMYIPTSAILTASYLSSEYLTSLSQGLGSLLFSWQGPSATVNISIMRALGDDAMFYFFNGFPLRQSQYNFSGVPFDTEIVHPAMFSLLGHGTNNSIAKAADSITVLTETLQNFLLKMIDNVSLGSQITTLATQIAHVIVNPTMTTFALSVIQILNSFSIFSLSFTAPFIGLLNIFYSKFINNDRTVPASDVKSDINVVADISSTILSGFVSLFSSRPKNLTFTEKISTTFSVGANIHTRMLGFVKSILEFSKKCVTFVCKRLYPQCDLLSYLEDDSVLKWIERVSIMCDTLNYNKISKNKKASGLVWKLVKQGENIVTLVSKQRDRDTLMIVVRALQDIKRLRDKLGLIAHVPVVKFDPFCFYISGRGSQIGKSDMLDELVRVILEDNDILPVDRNNYKYVVPESDKWFTGYTNQEAIIFDDFGRKMPDDVSEWDGSYLANLKGSANWEVPKPFEDKGCIAVCKLIACASNFAFPKHNKMLKPDVVWKRRNVLYLVKADMTIYASCKDCSEFTFVCALCIKAAKDAGSDFSLRKHLTFTKVKPDSEYKSSPIGAAMNFSEMKEDLRFNAKVYYENQNADFKRRQEEVMKFTKEEDWNNLYVPSSIGDDYAKLITEDVFVNVLNDIGITVHPAGDKTELEVDCWHHVIYDKGIIPIWNKPFSWLVNDVTYFADSPCSGTCSWDLFQDDYWNVVRESYTNNGIEMPEEVPEQLRPGYMENIKERLNAMKIKIKAEPWYEKHSSLLKLFGIGIAFVGVVATCHYIFGKDKEKKNDKEMDVAPDGTHPALKASSDISTKFLKKFRSNVERPSKVNMQRIKPAGVDEYESMRQCYKESIVEMVSFDELVIARCVSVANGVYMTQLHSFCSVLTKSLNRISELQKECSCSDIHTAACTQRVNDQSMFFFRRRVKNEIISIRMTPQEFFMKNGDHFGVDSEGSDMLTFRIGVENFKTNNIMKYLVSSKNNYVDYNNTEFYDPGSIKKNNEFSELAKQVIPVQTELKYEEADLKLWAPDYKEVRVKLYGFTISNPISNGFQSSCGSVLFDKSTVSIIGIMSAASKSTLYFNGLSKEQMQDAFGLGLKETTLDSKGKVISVRGSGNNFEDLSDDITQGCIGVPAMRVYHSIKTTIRKSECFEKFGPVVRAPCHISQDGDNGIKSMENGLKNYVPHIKFPDCDIEAAYRDISAMFLNNCKSDINIASKRSIREAVCGIVAKIPRLTMTTSPGFPWCCDSKTSRKSDLLKFDDDGYLKSIHKGLKHLIDVEETAMESMSVPTTVFQLSHKDAKQPLNKLDEVRLIQGSPLSLTISSRRYLMDFNYAFQLSRWQLEHCVGINTDSMEWDRLTRELVDFSPHICVGDYSKFGPRLLNDFVKGSYQIMFDWYEQFGCDEKHQTARLILGQRVINSLNLCYNRVVQVQCGSPSGAINTVVVNSICNMFYIRCAWIGIMREKKEDLQGLHHFRDKVKFFCYGDDVIFAVKGDVVEFFNNATISEYFAKFDVKYTDVSKDGTIRKFCKIVESSFLKRGFKFYEETPIKPGVWIAVPNYNEIIDITNWVRLPKGTKTGADVQNVLNLGTIENCEDAMRKMWFHGREKFEMFRTLVHEFWRYKSVPRKPIYYDFDGLQLDYGIPIFGDTKPAEDLGLYIGRSSRSPNPQVNTLHGECLHNPVEGKFDDEASEKRRLSLSVDKTE